MREGIVVKDFEVADVEGFAGVNVPVWKVQEEVHGDCLGIAMLRRAWIEGSFESFEIAERHLAVTVGTVVAKEAGLDEGFDGGFVRGVVCMDFNVVGNGGFNVVDHGGGVFPVGTVGENEVGEVDCEWIDIKEDVSLTKSISDTGEVSFESFLSQLIYKRCKGGKKRKKTKD